MGTLVGVLYCQRGEGGFSLGAISAPYWCIEDEFVSKFVFCSCTLAH